jgi:sulfopyruvate decarboxylase subunit beta
MLARDHVLTALREAAPEAVIVTHLGGTTSAHRAISDTPRDFYMLGSMGSVIPFSLGIALATATQVIAVEGDGGLLMSLGSLATVGRHKAQNLSIVILDNGRYESTGSQPTPQCDFQAVASAAGVDHAETFSEITDLPRLSLWAVAPGSRIAIVKTLPSRTMNPPVTTPPEAIAQRLSQSLHAVSAQTLLGARS